MLIENFRTGTMESFGLGYDDALRSSTRGSSTARSPPSAAPAPARTRPGYEALMQAFSGIMSITGEPGGQPVRAGVSFLDLSTGILCALGVSAAVHPAPADRPRPARGRLAARDGGEPARLPRRGLSPHRRHPEGARLRASVALALPQLQVPGTGSGSSSPPPTTASGRSSPAPSAWTTWPPTRASPMNEQRVKNRAELEAILERVIGERDREPLLKILEEADVPATPVNTVDQVMNDPQTIAARHRPAGAPPASSARSRWSARRSTSRG